MINTMFSKICFQDWLYFLLYDLKMTNWVRSNSISDNHESIFRESRIARFRFEQRENYSLDALHDDSYQYGNYHLSKIKFNEDFSLIKCDEFFDKISSLVHNHVYENISEELKTKAIEIINSQLKLVLQNDYEIYQLNTESESVASKVAPFATFYLFKGFIAFNKKDIDNFLYIELGCD